MKTDEDESALARWSRRKRESSQQNSLLIDETTTEPVTQKETISDNNDVVAVADIDQLSDQDMPDIESLNEESSYAEFFSKNVSNGLRKLALQKLFHCKSYNICDGLDDYDGNYTAFEKLDASIITADMKHRLEMEAQERLEELAEADNNPETDTELVAAETIDENKDPELTDSPIGLDSLSMAEDDVAMPANEKST